ncbi:MAG: glycosyltransferase family 25 protein [Methylococcales bacterium]
MSAELVAIYVINVKEFTARKQLIESQLSKLNLNAEFILDWDKEELTTEIIEQFFANHQLSIGQMSCATKHIVALRHITKHKNGFCLVLEDDALFSENFLQGLSYALKESANFPGPKVIFIGSGGNFYTPKSQQIKGQHLYIGNRGRFADSYIIDASTAHLRLDWIAKYKVSQPIDNQFETIDKQLGIKMLWLEAPVVEQGSKAGVFDSSLEPAPPPWLQKILFGWEKIKRKYIYQLWK